MIVNLVVCWCWLQFWFLDFPNPFGFFFKKQNRAQAEKEKEAGARIKRVLRESYRELGSVSFHELAVGVLFVSLVFLWVFRDPQFMTGWGNYIEVEKDVYSPLNATCTDSDCLYKKSIVHKEAIDDATAGFIVVLMLFVLPAKLNFWPFTKRWQDSTPSPGLLEWSKIHAKMPWAIVMLLGGGFALAKATDKSGLSRYIGHKLQVLEFMPPEAMVLVICLFVSFATEVTSNVATCSIILPVLKNLAVSLKLNPLYLMLPATLTCSYAFMLPVATPPNAIVYSASGMKTTDMVKCGFFVNVLCVIVNYLCLNSYASAMFHLGEFPEWAEKA